MTVGSFVASVPVAGETVSLIPADGHEQYGSEETIRNPCGIHQRSTYRGGNEEIFSFVGLPS
jgi:hypothetical protein